jgi:hypothetical protein
MLLVPSKRINASVFWEMKNTYPDLTSTEDYGYQGRRYVYYTVNLTDKQYLLFMLKYGEYF